jgi:hypothetical protein
VIDADNLHLPLELSRADFHLQSKIGPTGDSTHVFQIKGNWLVDPQNSIRASVVSDPNGSYMVETNHHFGSRFSRLSKALNIQGVHHAIMRDGIVRLGRASRAKARRSQPHR